MANYDGPRARTGSPRRWRPCSARSWAGTSPPAISPSPTAARTPSSICSTCWRANFADGRKKKVLFLLAPEYIGYADSALADDYFVAYKPTIEKLADGQFKYHVDFESLQVGDDIGDLRLPPHQPHRQRVDRRRDRTPRPDCPRQGHSAADRQRLRRPFSGHHLQRGQAILERQYHPLHEPSPSSACRALAAASSSPTRRSFRPSPT